MLKYNILLIIILAINFSSFSQKKITFKSGDGLEITADYYKTKTSATTLVLLHQAGSSRGEYRESIARFTRMGFSCLAVDLRSGKEINFVTNETAKRAKKQDLPTDYLDAEKDIIAAIEYAFALNNKKIVLIGSSYSASLALKISTGNDNVRAVIAFSPGEYFKQNKIIIQDIIKDLKIPIFATSTKSEFKYIKEMFKNVGKNKILFEPTSGEGVHGAKTLWKNNPNYKEYWFQITMFLKNYK